MDIYWLASFLGSAIFGGLAGGIYTHWRNSRDAKEMANKQESALIAALIAEISYIRRLCDYNARLQHDSIAPFVRFPTNATLKAAFHERYLYPKLEACQTKLEAFAVGILQLNQLVDFRENTYTMQGWGNINPQGSRDEMRNRVSAICAGSTKIEAPESQEFSLPGYADDLLNTIKSIPK